MNPMQDWPVISARRFELYVRWSLYILMGALPVQMLLFVVSASAYPDVVVAVLGLLVLSLVVTVFNVGAARWSLDRVMGRERDFSRWVLTGWALSLILLSVGLVWVLAESPEMLLVLAMPWACAVGAISPSLTVQTVTRMTVVALLIGGGAALFVAVQGLFAVFFFLFIVWSAWSSGWMLRVLRQLHQAHETAAQLTVAEERLRISRDLHDVFGRTLATISVKSELAAELSRRGHHERAADEMADIRRIANTAGAEVRRVVRGERRAGWADEVEGARALLTSAGIRCLVAGEEVPEEYAETLAWVIREGVTNVLRHSRATQVGITTAVEADEVALTLSNDGASDPSAIEPGGTGLVSMAERLRAVGGSLDFRHDGDWFLLTASIPVPQEVTE